MIIRGVYSQKMTKYNGELSKKDGNFHKKGGNYTNKTQCQLCKRLAAISIDHLVPCNC